MLEDFCTNILKDDIQEIGQNVCLLQYVNRKCKASGFNSGLVNYLGHSAAKPHCYLVQWLRQSHRWWVKRFWQCCSLLCTTGTNLSNSLHITLISNLLFSNLSTSSLWFFFKASSESPVVIKNNMLTPHSTQI